MNILITGASGLIGHHLTSKFLMAGHKVAHLGRTKSSSAIIQQFQWDLKSQTIEEGAVTWADAIVNLAGANVSEGRWTDKRKLEIIESRTEGTKLIAKAIQREKAKVKCFVSASAVGYYGMITTDKIFSETAAPSTDFFGVCCSKWESTIDLLEEIGLRTVKLRIGVVLAKEGGALPKLILPVKWFIGSPLGSGKQWMPWIHIDDLCELFLKGVEDEKMSGAYNAVTSNPVTNKEFVKSIGKIIHRPVFLPAVPKFVLKMMLGEMSGIVTEGSRASNEKILQTGFLFKYNNLEMALGNLLN